MHASPLNIYLRPFELNDVSAFTAAVNDSLDSLIPWMVWAHHDYQPHEAESWIRFTHSLATDEGGGGRVCNR